MRRSLRSRRGTAYVEYFLLAAAMAAAVIGLMGRADSLIGPLTATFNGQMSRIAGGVAIP